MDKTIIEHFKQYQAAKNNGKKCFEDDDHPV